MFKKLSRFLFFAAIGCGGDEDEGPQHRITLGAAIDRTSLSATISWEESIKLAVRDFNAGLAKSSDARFKDTEFTLIFGDTQSNTDLAPERATELVQQGAKSLLVMQAPVAQAVLMLNYDEDPTNDLSVAIVCPNCMIASINNPNATHADPVTQAALRDADNWFLRTVMDNGNEVSVIINLVAQTDQGDLNGDGVLKITTYSATDASHGGWRTKVLNTARAIRSDAIVEDAVRYPFNLNVDHYDFATDVRKLVDNINENTNAADNYPDFLLEQSPPGISAAATKAYRTAGHSIRFLHNANFRNANTIPNLGDLANGQEGMSVVVPADSESGRSFTAGITPITGAPQVLDAQFYDAASVLMLAHLIAMQDAGASTLDPVTPVQIRDALLKTSDAEAGAMVGVGSAEFARAADLIAAGAPINFDGASGPVDFDAVGNVKNVITRWVVENRTFVDKERFDCISSSSCPQIQ